MELRGTKGITIFDLGLGYIIGYLRTITFIGMSKHKFMSWIIHILVFEKLE